MKGFPVIDFRRHENPKEPWYAESTAMLAFFTAQATFPNWVVRDYPEVPESHYTLFEGDLYVLWPMTAGDWHLTRLDRRPGELGHSFTVSKQEAEFILERLPEFLMERTL